MSDVSDLNPPVRVAGLTDFAHGTWPDPAPPRLRLPLAALVCGVVAAVVLPDVGFGVNVFGVALLITVAVLVSVRGRKDNEGRRPAAFAVGFTAIAVLLSGVAVVRASEWLVTGCLLAAVVLGMMAAIGTRRWGTLLATGPLFIEAAVRAMPWAASALNRYRQRQRYFKATESVFFGVLFGTVCAVTVGMLLASADATFARLLSSLGGWLTLDVRRTDLLVARVVLLTGTTLFVLGLSFAASTKLKQPPARPLDRHPAEWLSPLILVAATIAAFLVVDATRLFGAGAAVLQETSTTHAERAREGFGQLTVVTVLVLLLIGAAGRVAADRHRRWLGFAGGTLLLLALLLAFSALRRLWLYQADSGWTVARLNGGAFELWVVVVLVAVGVTWLIRRTDLLPRLTAGSAGLGLLVIALAGPDALVAAANVHRYEKTQQIDTEYLSYLSADAVPALMKLPEPIRSQSMPREPTKTSWYGWNWSRHRAENLLNP